MPIKIAQSSAATERGRWKWSVWLDGTDVELDGVEYVVYTLHPTFPQPVRRIEDRQTAFRLYSGGWGEFNIHALVQHRDGRVQQLEHWLTLFSDVGQWLERGGGSLPEAAVRGASPRPRIYLSYSVADASSAKALIPLLGQAGVEVTTSEEIDDANPELPFEQAIKSQLRSVSRAVFLVSDHASPWLRREAEMAGRLGIPLAYITVGGGTPPADDDPAVVSLHVEQMDSENVGEVARAITHWATNAGTPAPVRVILRGESKA